MLRIAPHNATEVVATRDLLAMDKLKDEITAASE